MDKTNTTVLIVEDDAATAKLVETYLLELGLTSRLCTTGEAALLALSNSEPIAVVIDIGLPGLSGIEVCKRIRSSNSQIPICILTSRSEEVDIVLGLESGADDYLLKPIRRAEFIARIRALLRRTINTVDSGSHTTVKLGDFLLNQEQVEIFFRKKLLSLTKTEFALLSHLILSRGCICTKSRLLASVWGYHSSTYEGTLGTHISRLRSKLEQVDSDKPVIQTVWGIGYRLVLDEDSDVENGE